MHTYFEGSSDLPSALSDDYKKVAFEPSVTTEHPQKQLVILDLNGTLISRCKAAAGNRGFYVRPHHVTFLDYLFEQFTVMVWSSARQQAVEAMCKVFEERPLLLKWDRSHFGLSNAQFYAKTETVKELTRVWDELPEFDAKNTIIIDDTCTKLVNQPFNLIQIGTFDHNEILDSGVTDHELLKVVHYLQQLRSQSNVASYMRLNPFDSQLSYHVVPDLQLDTAMHKFNKHGRDVTPRPKDEEKQKKLKEKHREELREIKRQKLRAKRIKKRLERENKKKLLQI